MNEVLMDTLRFVGSLMDLRTSMKIINIAIETHPTLTLEDWVIFNKRICSGTYGKIFGELKPVDIMNWLLVYLEERCDAHEAFLAEQKGAVHNRKPLMSKENEQQLLPVLQDLEIAMRENKLTKQKQRLTDWQYRTLKYRLSIGDIDNENYTQLKADAAKTYSRFEKQKDENGKIKEVEVFYKDEPLIGILSLFPDYQQNDKMVRLSKELTEKEKEISDIQREKSKAFERELMLQPIISNKNETK